VLLLNVFIEVVQAQRMKTRKKNQSLRMRNPKKKNLIKINLKLINLNLKSLKRIQKGKNIFIIKIDLLREKLLKRYGRRKGNQKWKKLKRKRIKLLQVYLIFSN